MDGSDHCKDLSSLLKSVKKEWNSKFFTSKHNLWLIIYLILIDVQTYLKVILEMRIIFMTAQLYTKKYFPNNPIIPQHDKQMIAVILWAYDIK